MAREFNIRPVQFPGSNPTIGGGGGGISTAQQRRTQPQPNPQFQQPRPASSNIAIPFFSTNLAAPAGPMYPNNQQFNGPPIGANANANFEEEPPLLEELGINTRQVWNKTVSILMPFRVNSRLHEDADLSGPFLLIMAFGLFQLLAGKIHFGILLGWVTVSALFLYVVFNMLAGRHGNLDVYMCLSLIGYCMLPIVILSALALFLPQGGMVIFGMAALFVLWSTKVCTGLVVELAACGVEHRWLIAYPCLLIYVLFSYLVIF